MLEFTYIVKALADTNRLRALIALEKSELCVCQLQDLLGLASSTVSKHMSVLRQAHLVEGTKKGRWMYYRLPGSEASADVQRALQWISQALERKPEIREDRMHLKKILTEEESPCRIKPVSRKTRKD